MTELKIRYNEEDPINGMRKVEVVVSDNEIEEKASIFLRLRMTIDAPLGTSPEINQWGAILEGLAPLQDLQVSAMMTRQRLMKTLKDAETASSPQRLGKDVV